MKRKNTKNEVVKYIPIEPNPKKDLRIAYILFGILILLDVTFALCYITNAYIITRPVELAGSIECNTGKIGVDYQSIYNNSLQKNNITLLNESYNFNEIVGWTPKVFNLKGIDNLYCKAQFNSKTQISDAISIIKLLYDSENKYAK